MATAYQEISPSNSLPLHRETWDDCDGFGHLRALYQWELPELPSIYSTTQTLPPDDTRLEPSRIWDANIDRQLDRFAHAAKEIGRILHRYDLTVATQKQDLTLLPNDLAPIHTNRVKAPKSYETMVIPVLDSTTTAHPNPELQVSALLLRRRAALQNPPMAVNREETNSSGHTRTVPRILRRVSPVPGAWYLHQALVTAYAADTSPAKPSAKHREFTKLSWLLSLPLPAEVLEEGLSFQSLIKYGSKVLARQHTIDVPMSEEEAVPDFIRQRAVQLRATTRAQVEAINRPRVYGALKNQFANIPPKPPVIESEAPAASRTRKSIFPWKRHA